MHVVHAVARLSLDFSAGSAKMPQVALLQSRADSSMSVLS